MAPKAPEALALAMPSGERPLSLKDWIKGRVGDFDRWMRPWASRSALNQALYEFLLFGLKQAWACLFGGAMLALILGTHLFWPAHAPVARYDVLVVAALLIQVGMLATRLERWEEAAVIAIFHVVGTVMEIFKTAHGSWIYPEPNILRIGGVPLFSGFMYACIGSYIARAWRLFDFRFSHWPPAWAPWTLAVLSYGNFFTHHWWPDIRLGLFAFSALIWWRSWIWFTPDRIPRRMPVLLSIVLVSVFIWLAENLGTFAGAWVYPNQKHGWSMVPIEKMGAWYLLIILSFVLVTIVSRVRVPDTEGALNPSPPPLGAGEREAAEGAPAGR
jgi:uncharacterized membrane protein YoaT (DUF817 family)